MPYDEILSLVEIVKWPVTVLVIALILRRELRGRTGE